jgi:hypothetical protein
MRTRYFDDGCSILAEWVDGQPVGHGMWTNANGISRAGLWEVRGNVGSLDLETGESYFGDLFEGRRHGVGTHTWPNGSSYVGDWKNDAPHGHGTFRWANGDELVASFDSGLCHGAGVATLHSGKVTYDGHFEWHKYSGHGRMVAKRWIYEGEWLLNQFHGLGCWIDKKSSDMVRLRAV